MAKYFVGDILIHTVSGDCTLYQVTDTDLISETIELVILDHDIIGSTSEPGDKSRHDQPWVESLSHLCLAFDKKPMHQGYTLIIPAGYYVDAASTLEEPDHVYQGVRGYLMGGYDQQTPRPSAKKACTCSTFDVFNFGCKCGGV